MPNRATIDMLNMQKKTIIFCKMEITILY